MPKPLFAHPSLNPNIIPGATGAAGGDLTGSYPDPLIAPGKVTQEKLADLAVSDAKIAGVSWAKIINPPTGLPPSGNAGNALTGTYPNPGLAANVVALVNMTQAARDRLVPTPTMPADQAKLLTVDTSGFAQWMPLTTTQIPNGSIFRAQLATDVTPSLPPLPTIGEASKIVTVNPGGTALIYAAAPPATLTPGQVTTTYLGDAPLGASTAKINDGAVTDAKIATVAWTKVTGAPTSFPPSGSAGGDLSGSTYPNPSVIPAARSKWTVSGATLTPTDATKSLVIPGTGAVGSPGEGIQVGNATSKNRFTKQDWRMNISSGDVIDDPVRPQWALVPGQVVDGFFIYHSPPGATVSWTALLTLDYAGNFSLAPTTATFKFGKYGLITASDSDVTWFYNDPRSLTYDAARQKFAVAMDNALGAIMFYRAPAGGGYAAIGSLDSGGNLIIVGAGAQKASGTTWSNPSDRRLKDDITDYPTGLAAILALQPRTFVYNGKGGSPAGVRGYGFIADEVEPVMPETVSVRAGKLDPADDTDTDIQTLDQSNLILALVNAVKELAARVGALEGAPA